MAASIAHRGPDDEGFFISGSLGLGFRRLSIIDLDGGHQPMSDREGRVWVVFNGEIYNHVELRDQLTTHGHTFLTKSDTEVIVHGYSHWGLDVFDRLKGMFGIAIWDVGLRRLILARDAMGIKPLYYQVKNGQLFFGSEVKPLTAEGGHVKVDPIGLRSFLQFRFTPSPRTIYEGVRKLAPGEMLIAEGGAVQVIRWYAHRPKPVGSDLTDAEACQKLLDLYKGAVKRHLLSDVPVGLLLSGGIDSGLLLALMSSSGDRWPTFSVGYGPSYKSDELVDAAETARIFGAQHVGTTIDRRMFEQDLQRIVGHLEEPIAASSIVPMYFVCRRAREDVKVVLNGQGPDELFGGYRRHLGVQYAPLWSGLPEVVRTLIANGIRYLPRNETLKRGISSLDITDPLERHTAILSLAPGAQITDLFHKDLLPEGSAGDVPASWSELHDLARHSDELGRFQYIETHSTLPDELLMYADKMSMAHGLEVRVPYLDQDVVEFAERLDARFKVRAGRKKWLHRRVCKNYLPRSIVSRRKRGFSVDVVDAWFRQSTNGGLPHIFSDDASLMYRLLRPEAVRELLSAHRTGRADHHKILFSLVMLEHWLRNHHTSTSVS